MKSGKSIGLFIIGIAMTGLGVGVYIMMRKKEEQVDEPVVSSSSPVANNQNIVTNNEQIQDQIVTNNEQVQDQVLEQNNIVISDPVLEIPLLPDAPQKPTWFTDQMQTTFQKLYQYYKSVNDGSGYADFINRWALEKYRIKNEEDYLIEKAIWDLKDVKKSITPYQAFELRRYYGIGKDILPLKQGVSKPSFLMQKHDGKEKEFHLWTWFTAAFHGDGLSREDSFDKALNGLKKVGVFTSSQVATLENSYDTSMTI